MTTSTARELLEVHGLSRRKKLIYERNMAEGSAVGWTSLLRAAYRGWRLVDVLRGLDARSEQARCEAGKEDVYLVQRKILLHNL